MTGLVPIFLLVVATCTNCKPPEYYITFQKCVEARSALSAPADAKCKRVWGDPR